MVVWRRRAFVWAAVLLVLVAAVSGALYRIHEGTAVAMPDCPQGPAIVIDPGHGGVDGGTNVPGLLEKEIVLDVALRTKEHLDRYHVPVILTRSEDTGLGGTFDSGHLRRDLNYRIRVANHCKAGLMLSLHVNSTKDPASRGMILFYQPTRAGRDAAYLFDDILRQWPLHSRKELPHPRTDFAVLKTKSPAILVEMGFISNAEDRRLLADPAYREQLARALSSACTAIYQKWLKDGTR